MPAVEDHDRPAAPAPSPGGQDNDFSLRNLAAAADSAAAETTRVMSVLLGAIASVSLARRRHRHHEHHARLGNRADARIGIRMAIGARQRDILTQFLLEAMMISIAGCLIGLLSASAAQSRSTPSSPPSSPAVRGLRRRRRRRRRHLLRLHGTEGGRRSTRSRVLRYQ